MDAGQGLARGDRVRRRPDFERAYSEGTRIHGRYMTVFVVSNAASRSRLGVAATRKFGPATVRNRAKRLARELFRRHRIDRDCDAERGVDIVVVPRLEMVEAPFAQLEADYLRVLAKRNQPGPTGRQPIRRARPRGHKGV